MRGLIIILVLIASTHVNGQTERVEIPWNSDSHMLSFQGAHYENSGDSLPFFTKRVSWESKELKPIISVIPTKTEAVPSDYFKITTAELITSQINVEYEMAFEKNKPYLLMKFLPFLKGQQDGSIERILNFDIQISSQKNETVLKSREFEGWKSNSVLASGTWFKIAVVENGIHKLTYSQLKDIGLSSPENVRIYGFGARILPEQFSQGHIDDLDPITLHMHMGGDDSFGPGDYILFYAEGPVGWKFRTEDQYFYHERHNYSWQGYYFITDDHGKSIPAQKLEISTESPTHKISSYDYRDFIEDEKYNLINSGKEWYGDNFNISLEENYPFKLPNNIPGENIVINVNAVIRSNVNSAFSLKANNESLGSISAKGTDLSYYVATYAKEAEGIFSFKSQEENLTVTLTYNRPNNNSEGWLNYITINSRSKLKMFGDQLPFRDSRSIGTGNVGEFRIENSNKNLVIWDITKPGNSKEIEYSLAGSAASFKIPHDSLREFIAFYHEGDFPVPLFNEKGLGPVANQNLHGLQHPDMVLITPEILLEQAQRLAEHRKANDGLETAIVLQQEVFNEFSSGTPDVVAIRNFLKMFYDRSENSGEYCKYLLLFGDGSFDNRNSTEQNTNLILTYQSDNSLSPTRSYVSDDFFGLLDTDESLSNGLLDIGIGRLPVSTVEEAEIVVDKIIGYSEPGTMETWRNEICFIGDDEDSNIHMRQADQLATKVLDLHPGFNINKIYLDAYKQVEGATGFRYPDVNRAINDQINRGALIVNYTGHGGPTGLAHEQILTMNDIFSWTNKSTLPLIMTATCEFSRYDEYDYKQDQEYTSAGEEVLLSPNGGSVGLFTTTRLVYSGPNYVLNEKFYDIVFSKDENQQSYRLGDIIAYSKNNAGAGINKRNFSLLGDPSMKLAMPENIVVTDSINGIDVKMSIDTLSAFEKVTVSGHLETISGKSMDTFEGKVFPVVYDKENNIKTLANDNGPAWNFQSRNSILYKGETTVNDGRFSFEFFVPKDINYSFGDGKIIYYSRNTLVDAHGSFEGFKIGGTGKENAIDSKAPDVEVFLNDSFFVSGGITDKNPELLVHISDNFGINTSGNGIGHDLTATLDGDRLGAIVLNEFYQSNLGSFNSGVIRYLYSDMENGPHKITVKIWDIHNNSAQATIEFMVTESEEMLLENLYNYPNPFQDKTWFNIEHNRPDKLLRARLMIYNMTGQLIKIIESENYSAGYRLEPIEWDGNSTGGSPLDGGVYLYKIVLSTEEGEIASSTGKLIISR